MHYLVLQIGKAQGAAADVARKVEASGAVLESLHVKRAAQAKLVNELTAKVGGSLDAPISAPSTPYSQSLLLTHCT